MPEPTIWDELGHGMSWVLREVISEVRTRAVKREQSAPPPGPVQRPVAPWDQPPPWAGKAPPWNTQEAADVASVPAVKQPAAPDGGAAYSYAAEMDRDPSTACINCTRRHLWEMRVASEKMAEAAARGDDLEARRRALRVIGEGLALHRFDWTDAKLANVKSREGGAIAAAAPHVGAILATAPQPPQQLALAWSSLDEALRFARSPVPTESDRMQIDERLDETGAMISDCESEVLPRLPDEDRQWMERVLPDLRSIRHSVVEHLNGRQELGKDEIAQAEQYLHQVALEMTPAPDAATARALAQRAAAAERDFKQALFFGRAAG